MQIPIQTDNRPLTLAKVVVRRLESGRILLVLPEGSEEYFEDPDSLYERIDLINSGGRFGPVFSIDDEVDRCRRTARIKIRRCGRLDQ
jgi:hypothetical protein